jgi:uncharacterized membrane protein/predicted transcriptional regulator
LAAVASGEVAFFELPADVSAPARPLATFGLAAQLGSEPLSGSRLAVNSPREVALATIASGRATFTGLDPFLGEFLWQQPISLSSESVEQVSVAATTGGYVVAYVASSGQGRVAVVVQFDTAGTMAGRASVSAAGVAGAAMVDAEPAPFLALLGSSSVSLFVVEAGPVLRATGTVALLAQAGALWAEEGTLGGLFSTPTGMVRLQAPLTSISSAQLAPIAGGGGALSVAASGSADGKLVAAVTGRTSSLLLREDNVGEYSTATMADMRAAAAVTDRYGLARLATVRGSTSQASMGALFAGDPDALRVDVQTPAPVLPAGSGSITLTMTAVRTPLTVVGIEVAMPVGWSSAVDARTVSIPSGGSLTSRIDIQVPPGTAGGPYTVTISPSVLETVVRFSGSAVVEVPSANGLEATVSGNLDLDPGQTGEFDVTVRNRGGSPAVADISAQAPDGFILTPSSSQVTVSPGQVATVRFSVTAAQGAAPLVDTSLQITVRSQAGGAETKLAVGASINPVFAPSLDVERGDMSATPGSEVRAPVSIVNSGNVGRQVAVLATLTGLPASALVVSQAYVWLPPFSKTSAGVLVTVPASALAGYPYEVFVAIADPQSGDALAPSVSVAGTVQAASRLEARFLGGPAVRPGDESAATLVLQNRGNSQITVDLAMGPAPNGYAVRVVNAPTGGIILRPFASVEVPVLVRVPTFALPGAVMFPVSVTSSTVPALSLQGLVTVLQTHGISLRTLTGPTTVLDPRVSNVAVEFEVTNIGNVQDTLVFSFSPEPTAFYVVAADGTLAPLNPLAGTPLPPRAVATYRAALPPTGALGAEASSARLAVEATSGASVETTFEILRPLSDPRVVSLSVSPLRSPSQVGELHAVVANLRNEGPATAVDLTALLSAEGVVVGAVPLLDLSPGRERVVTFDFVPRQASTALTVTIVAADPGSDRVIGNNAASVVYEAAVPAKGQAVSPTQAAPVALASFSILVLIALAFTEIGKLSLISTVFLPLFVKLNPDEVLDQYLRGQIHGYIIANPGEHYNAIKDQLGVTNGALAYHLRVLEKAGLIRAQRDGMYKRFYPMGVKIPKRRRLSIFQEAVVKAVRDNPEVSQKRVAELLGVSNQVVNYHVKQLEDSGVLKVDRTARASKLILGPEAPPGQNGAPPALPAAPPAPAEP